MAVWPQINTFCDGLKCAAGILTRSSGVAVIADHTAYDVPYSYRPLSGISVVSNSAWVFTYLQFQTEVCFWWQSAFLPFVAKQYILQQKCLKKWIGSSLLWTWWYTTFNPLNWPWVPQYFLPTYVSYWQTNGITDRWLVMSVVNQTAAVWSAKMSICHSVSGWSCNDAGASWRGGWSRLTTTRWWSQPVRSAM